MVASSFPVCGLLLLLNLQLFSSFPIMSDADVDMLKVILHKLEESVSEQTEVDQRVPGDGDVLDSLDVLDTETADGPQTRLDTVAAIREFLSARNLKNVRNDSSRRSSSCFGRRMDRIGSMSSLGCNTVGKYNPK